MLYIPESRLLAPDYRLFPPFSLLLFPTVTPAEASFSLVAGRDKHRGATNKHGLFIPACPYIVYIRLSSFSFCIYLLTILIFVVSSHLIRYTPCETRLLANRYSDNE